jgi:hypothetical protein
MSGFPLGDFLADMDLVLPAEALEYEVLEFVSYTGERIKYGPNGEIKGEPCVENDGRHPNGNAEAPTGSDGQKSA